MPLAQEVIDRLLVAKGLLNRIRFQPMARPDRVSMARHILTAHDAAELTIAAVAQAVNRLPQSRQTYLMDYFPAIREEHPERDVRGRDYMSQLNQVRVNIKHLGVFPDPQQWRRIGERTWEYASGWCEEYLGISLDDLDESALIVDADVKGRYDNAVAVFERGDYRAALEELAFGMDALFRSSGALRNLSVGLPRAEDAIKLAAFGVHANDFLALQEFLPQIVFDREGNQVVRWKQEEHGHPANWTHDCVAFSLKAFIDVVLRIQDAERIPGAIDFFVVYEHKITAIVDEVEIVEERRRGVLEHPERVIVRTLRKGESLRGMVSQKEGHLVRALMGRGDESEILRIVNIEEEIFGWEVEADKVRVTCVPRDKDIVRKYFPDLPEIDYEP